MSRIVVHEFITLDGVVQSPGSPDEDREGGFEHGGWIAGYDFGNTVEEWESKQNSQLLGPDVRSSVAELRADEGGEIRVWGSTELVRTLAGHDLIDEYRLAVVPLVLGTGKKLFADGFSHTHFDLTGNRALTSGVVINTYQRTDDR